MSLVKKKPPELRKTVLIKARLPGTIGTQFESAWQSEGYASKSAYVLDAIKEKLRRGELQKNEMQRLIQALNRFDKRIAGLQSMIRLVFAAVAGVATLLMRYFRETDLRAQESWVKEVTRNYYAEIGQTFDQVTASEGEEQRYAATGD